VAVFVNGLSFYTLTRTLLIKFSSFGSKARVAYTRVFFAPSILSKCSAYLLSWS